MVDDERNILGINKNAINLGITLSIKGEKLDERLYNKLLSSKEKIRVEENFHFTPSLKLSKPTVWHYSCWLPWVPNFPRFYIFTMEF
jgi:hypothetical protein